MCGLHVICKYYSSAYCVFELHAVNLKELDIARYAIAGYQYELMMIRYINHVVITMNTVLTAFF